MAALTIICLCGAMIAFGLLSAMLSISMFLGVIGSLGPAGWKRMPAIVISLLIAVSLVVVLDDFGIGIASAMVVFVWLLAGKQGLTLGGCPETNDPSESPLTKTRTMHSVLAFVPVFLVAAYLYMIWHADQVSSGVMLLTFLEVTVFVTLFLGIPWLCLRDPFRPVFILILVGCLWPWVSPLLFESMIGRSPGDWQQVFPNGAAVLPLSVPMTTAAFLVLRSCGMRLTWPTDGVKGSDDLFHERSSSS